MGCWNETCGFSQQSILADDKVVAFIIKLNSKPMKSCYADGTASPMAFPIRAEYNEYGSIQNPIKGFATESTIKLFNSYYTSDKLIINDKFFENIEKNKNSKWDGDVRGFDKETGFTDVETLFYGIERGYISFDDGFHHRSEENGLSFMLIKENVLTSAIETLEFNDDWERKNITFENVKKDIQLLFDEVFNSTVETEDSLYEQLENLDKSDPNFEESRKKIMRKIIKIDGDFKSWGGDDLKSNINQRGNICKILASNQLVDMESFRRLYNILKDDLYNKCDKEDIKNTIAQFIMTIEVFNLFRKSWSPQGCSSQDDNFDVTIEYMERLLRKLYDQRKERYKDGYYDDDGLPQVIGSLSIFEEGQIV